MKKILCITAALVAAAGIAGAKSSETCADVWANVPATGPADLWPAADPSGAVNVSKGATVKTAAAAAAFDGDKATAWTFDGKKGAAEIAPPADAKIWFVGVAAAGDDRKADPKKIAVSGSKNGTDWVAIAEGKNLQFGKAGEVQHVMLKSPGAWPAVRVEITANNGAGTTTVGEIELLAPAP